MGAMQWCQRVMAAVLCLSFPTPTPGPDEAARSQSCLWSRCPGCHILSHWLLSWLLHFRLSGRSCSLGLCPGSWALLPWLCSTSPFLTHHRQNQWTVTESPQTPRWHGVVCPLLGSPTCVSGHGGKAFFLSVGPQGKSQQPH